MFLNLFGRIIVNAIFVFAAFSSISSDGAEASIVFSAFDVSDGVEASILFSAFNVGKSTGSAFKDGPFKIL